MESDQAERTFKGLTAAGKGRTRSALSEGDKSTDGDPIATAHCLTCVIASSRRKPKILISL